MLISEKVKQIEFAKLLAKACTYKHKHERDGIYCSTSHSVYTIELGTSHRVTLTFDNDEIKLMYLSLYIKELLRKKEFRRFYSTSPTVQEEWVLVATIYKSDITSSTGKHLVDELESYFGIMIKEREEKEKDKSNIHYSTLIKEYLSTISKT